MKRLMTIVAAMLMMVITASAQEGKNIYNKYSGKECVSAVYISPAMFRLIGKLPDMQIQTEDGGSINVAPLVETFQGFYLLDVSDASLASTVKKEVDAMVSKGRYELLMEVKDGGENLHIYTAGDENIIESFVFIAGDSSEMQFICIDGAMNRSDVENLLISAAK